MLQRSFSRVLLLHTDNLLLPSLCPKVPIFHVHILTVGLTFFVILLVPSFHHLVKLGGPKQPGISSQSIAVSLAAVSLIATTYVCLEIVTEEES